MKAKFKAKWKGLTLAVFVCTILFSIGILNVSAESTISKGRICCTQDQTAR